MPISSLENFNLMMKFITVVSVHLLLFHICSANRIPSSCAELLLEGNTKSGIYTIYPRSWFKPIPFQVYCDMETDGGGWTIIQRREDYEPREDFYRTWRDYKKGFGDLAKEFWLGNERIYILTNQDHVSIRVDLSDFDGNERYAEYDKFHIESEKYDYRLTVIGYTGNANDSLTFHNNENFTAYDRTTGNYACTKKYKGGWWYKDCHKANLNGLYLKGKHESYADGVVWSAWLGFYYSLKKSEMKIRPRNFLFKSSDEQEI